MKTFSQGTHGSEDASLFRWAGWWRWRGWAGGIFGILGSVHLGAGTTYETRRFWFLGPLTVSLPLVGTPGCIDGAYAHLPACANRRGCSPNCPVYTWYEDGRWTGPSHLRPAPDRHPGWMDDEPEEAGHA